MLLSDHISILKSVFIDFIVVSFELTDGAWFAIALIVFVVITTNLTLWLAWKNRDNMHEKGLIDVIRRDMRSSWKKEEEQIGELNQLVSNISENKNKFDKYLSD